MKKKEVKKKKDIKELEEKCQEYIKDLQRIQAEFVNYKKRIEEEKRNYLKMGSEIFVLKILPILDNFRRAAIHVPEDLENSPWVLGIKQIEKHFEDILASEGLERIKTKGEHFDPQFHEAVFQEESKKYKEGEIIEEIDVGYKLKDKVIRPAKVKVATRNTQKKAENTEGD